MRVPPQPTRSAVWQEQTGYAYFGEPPPKRRAPQRQAGAGSSLGRASDPLTLRRHTTAGAVALHAGAVSASGRRGCA